MAITISGQNNNDKIVASDGVLDMLSGFNVVGVMTASSFDVGSNIKLGNAGIITATTVVGNVTGNLTGNVNHTSNLLLQISGSEKFRVGTSGQFGIAGANYGTSGQVLTSQGSGSAPQWATVDLTALSASNLTSGTIPDARFPATLPAVSGANLTGITQTTINNNADNRVITGSGTANTLEAESSLTYDGTNLDLGDGKYVRLGASNDFQMWHNGGTGNTNIKQQTGDVYFYTGSDLNMLLRDGTSVDLYYANSKRFETTADGIKITPDASGVAISSGGDTTWTTGAMNVVRMGSNQADIRLGSNYGVKIGVSGNNDSDEFIFGQDNTKGGYIRNEASSDIKFQTTTSGTTRFQVGHNGNCTINNGDLILASGHGIDFSATSDATHTGASGANPTTDSEKLTDYEHGTWTPRLRAYDHSGGAGWGTMKYTDGTDVIGSGRYVRIGNYVWAGFKFESGSKVFDSNWTYWSIDNTPYGANHYDKASGSLYVNQTNFFTNSNGMIGGFVHGNESYMVVNKPDGHLNATINTSNNNRYCYGHIAIYTSRT